MVSVERVAAEAQAARGCTRWYYSADFNEKCANVEYVLDFLAKRARAVARGPATRLQYIEQPTHRDLRANPENRMHEAAEIKPVVIDESLVDFESLLLSRELGYSGVALKACKGHSEALLMGAAAQKYGMFLCVQDLTCPGASFLHSATLSARIPTVAAIEGNGRQYCPAANAGWADAFPACSTSPTAPSIPPAWWEADCIEGECGTQCGTPLRGVMQQCGTPLRGVMQLVAGRNRDAHGTECRERLAAS